MEAVTGIKIPVIGKPSTMGFDMLIKDHFDNNIDKSKFLMIGDNVHTDIAFGANNGIDTCLVLSGITTLDELKEGKYEHKPTYYME